MSTPNPSQTPEQAARHSPYAADGGRAAQYDVQAWRKAAYYGGGVLMAVGFIMFFSVIAEFLLVFSHPSNAGSRIFGVFPFAFLGVFIIGAGSWLRGLGRRGLAGSGVLLSPTGEARDAEPWNRSQGAQDQQRLEEVTALGGLGRSGSPDVRVRCRSCGYLETEDAVYCSGCGARM